MKFELKSPGVWFSNGWSLLLAALLAAGGSGCKTYERYSPTYNLWDNDKTPSFCRPEADPKLALFDVGAGRDLLVVYNCASERHPGSRRRAYFLEASRARITNGLPPFFVTLKTARGLPTIPVIQRYSLQTDLDPKNVWARMQTQRDAFTLYRPGMPPATNELPHYQDYFPQPMSRSGKWGRAALTPLAVTLDVTVGVVVTIAVIGTATAGFWVPFVN